MAPIIKTKVLLFKIYLPFSFLGLLASCHTDQNEVKNMALKIRENQCTIKKISQYVDDSWTKSINKLGEYLPDRLPDQERKNILSLKNADLIRMFESYEEFDREGQALVDSMEKLDIIWADSLRNLSIENQQLEMKIDSLMSFIENPSDAQRLNQEIEEIRSYPCDDKQITSSTIKE